MAGLNRLAFDDGTKEIGLGVLLPNFWNCEFGTELFSAIMEHAKLKLNLEDIYATCDLDNIYSIKSLEKLGIKFVRNIEYMGENSPTLLLVKSLI